MIYFDGRHKVEVLDMREINEENFNPMCRHLLDKKNYVQILIDCVGGTSWVNVHRNQLLNADYGYILDEYGQPVCRNEWCGVKTNNYYANIPNMTCWSCGQPLSDKAI